MKNIWDMKKLSAAPKMWSAEDVVAGSDQFFFTEGEKRGKRPDGVEAIWYESGKYQKKSTRVFAWMGVPKTRGKKVPGVVLVHGGGGTAFAHWVKLWNDRGYAAIAMDTEGHVPIAPGYGKWNQHEWSGPNQSRTFDGIDLPLKEQWVYHAVSAVIGAHSLLRSLPGVDSQRIGICGISWGGFLTCISTGIDDRFKFAAPIYGCGFLGEDSCWTDAEFPNLGEKRRDKWLGQWDPSNYVPNAKLPTLWVTGSNDFAYSLGMVNHSYRVHGGRPELSIGIRYGHSHQHGWKRKESIAFADSNCGKTGPMIRITKQGRKNDEAIVAFDKRTTPKRAVLCYTNDEGRWRDRFWRTRKATIKAGVARAIVPSSAKASFFNLVDAKGLIISSPLL